MSPDLFQILVATYIVIITAIVAALGWILRGRILSNDRKHQDHYDHEGDMGLHETERDRQNLKDVYTHLNTKIDQHIADDRAVAETTNKKLDILTEDVKLILRTMPRMIV